MKLPDRLTPKLFVCWREGYSRRHFLQDLGAGLTVAVIALPLAMALGIGSIPQSAVDEAKAIGVTLSPPAAGLFTAVVAGFIISALGGSRVQIGGPTGAFMAIVYSVATEHGYSGLMLATLLAGAIVIIMGLAGFGGIIKFIPYPVTTGFTAGIAVTIASSQVKDFLGLQMGVVPPEIVAKCAEYWRHLGSYDPWTVVVALGSLGVILCLRRLAPRVPGAIVAVVLAAIAVALLDLPVATIGSRFGGIPGSLPTPRLPTELSLERIRELIPAATTIALLVAIESLLSAVVADGMIGGRHRSDGELVAQGIANIASAVFGGIPATGAIARTTANVKSGARTPIAGMIHAVAILGIMLLLAPLAARVPLGTLAAILMVVAWNMSEIDHFRALFRAPKSDVAVLLTTFGLTVFVDLTVAVGVGMVLASLLFMKRMAEVTDIGVVTRELTDSPGEFSSPGSRAQSEIKVPPEVEVFKIAGPFFFAVAHRLKDALNRVAAPPRVFILRVREVPVMDATGLHALEELAHKCRRQGIVLLLSGLQPQPHQVLRRAGLADLLGEENLLENTDLALARAKAIVASR